MCFILRQAFVLATHGEGWGRPAVEAMAMALPAVVTNWSGPMQFLTADTSFPIPVLELEDSHQGSWHCDPLLTY